METSTLNKRKKLGGHFFSFYFIEVLPSSISVLSFSEHSLGLNHTMHHSLDGFIWNLGLLWGYISTPRVWKVNLVYSQYEVRGAAAVVINDSKNIFEKVVWAFSDPKGSGTSGWKERSPTSLSAVVGGFCGNRSCFYAKDSKEYIFLFFVCMPLRWWLRWVKPLASQSPKLTHTSSQLWLL